MSTKDVIKFHHVQLIKNDRKRMKLRCPAKAMARLHKINEASLTSSLQVVDDEIISDQNRLKILHGLTFEVGAGWPLAIQRETTGGWTSEWEKGMKLVERMKWRGLLWIGEWCSSRHRTAAVRPFRGNQLTCWSLRNHMTFFGLALVATNKSTKAKKASCILQDGCDWTKQLE